MRKESLKKRNEELKLQLENRILEKKLNRSEVKMQYDAVAGSNQASGAGNKRRQASVESKEETGQNGLMRPYDRLLSINLARDAERNFSGAKSMLHQRKINIVGPSPKVQINTGDEFAAEATTWLNKSWMRNCDFRQTRRFAKLAQLVQAAKDREGDLLAVFDDNLISDSGKLLFYESDLICDVDGVKAEDIKAQGYTQQDGIISDKWGREAGYIASSVRGQTSVSSDKCTLFSRNPDNEDANVVKLIRSEFRLIQGRGISPMMSSIADLLDSYEMRSKELQTAKVAAALAGTIKRAEAVDDWDDPRLDPDNENPDDSEGSSSTLPEDQEAPATYERLEKLTGGYFDYLAEGDEFVLHDVKRPNVAMKEFLDYVLDSAGSSFGMAHAYTRMKADTSYTAFRGDMVMTWVSFYADQKDLENEFLDWAAIRAVRWAMRKGFIKSAAPEGWESKLSWKLPRIPYVDETKERTAHAQGLKNGEVTYSELLGPDWEEKFEQFAKELKSARAKNLPLSVFEAKSGGMSGTDSGDENKTDQAEETEQEGSQEDE